MINKAQKKLFTGLNSKFGASGRLNPKESVKTAENDFAEITYSHPLLGKGLFVILSETNLDLSKLDKGNLLTGYEKMIESRKISSTMKSKS